MFKGIQHFNRILFYLVLLLIFLTYIEMGPNNLHIYDGTSTAEIIGGDIFFEIIDPLELEYTYRIRPAKDFGAPFLSERFDYPNKAVPISSDNRRSTMINESFHIENVPLVPVYPKYCCNTPDNIEDIEGNVALIERGECSFKMKTIMAERAGARAVIITDITKIHEDYYIEMVDDDTLEEAHIPAGFLMGRNGLIIRKTLEKLKRNYAIINLPVNLTFTPIHEINQPPWLGW